MGMDFSLIDEKLLVLILPHNFTEGNLYLAAPCDASMCTYTVNIMRSVIYCYVAIEAPETSMPLFPESRDCYWKF